MTVRVVYIAGQSFSGSTVLCALLGVHPQLEPVSELAMWSRKAGQTGRTCSCGRSRLECPFWTVVHRTWLDSLGPLTVGSYAGLQSRIETIRYTWPQMFSRMPWQHPEEMQAYRRGTLALYRSVTAASGRSVVVDSSKKPGRAVAITGADGLDLRIIHLVRNGLSFVEAHLRRGVLSPTGTNYLYGVFRLGMAWSAINYAAERALSMTGSKGLRLRFEDLLQNPIPSLQSIGAHIDLDTECIQEHVQAGLPISWRHIESGSRHRMGGPAVLDPSFLKYRQLDGRTRLAFQLGGGVLSRRYGYQ